jgi:anti-sigma B factor antagonist
MATDELYSTCSTDGVLVVTFRQGDILDAMAIDRMSASVKELIQGAPETRFVLDFQHVPHLSSTALGMLIGLHRRIVQRQGRLKLAGINPDIMEVFRVTKLDTVFDIYRDSASAIEAFRKNL